MDNIKVLSMSRVQRLLTILNLLVRLTPKIYPLSNKSKKDYIKVLPKVKSSILHLMFITPY